MTIGFGSRRGEMGPITWYRDHLLVSIRDGCICWWTHFELLTTVSTVKESICAEQNTSTSHNFRNSNSGEILIPVWSYNHVGLFGRN
jgi:hypothetical protein